MSRECGSRSFEFLKDELKEVQKELKEAKKCIVSLRKQLWQIIHIGGYQDEHGKWQLPNFCHTDEEKARQLMIILNNCDKSHDSNLFKRASKDLLIFDDAPVQRTPPKKKTRLGVSPADEFVTEITDSFVTEITNYPWVPNESILANDGAQPSAPSSSSGFSGSGIGRRVSGKKSKEMTDREMSQ